MNFLFISNDTIIVFFQLLFSLVLGMLMGLQRNLSHKTAGMRTFALVSMGSTLFLILSGIIAKSYIGLSSDLQPMMMPAAIISGIGFLGAGLIIFHDDKVSGLTTAAGLWVACGMGIAVGVGQYSIALIATLLTLFVFTVLWDVEAKLKSAAQVRDGMRQEMKKEKMQQEEKMMQGHEHELMEVPPPPLPVEMHVPETDTTYH